MISSLLHLLIFLRGVLTRRRFLNKGACLGRHHFSAALVAGKREPLLDAHPLLEEKFGLLLALLSGEDTLKQVAVNEESQSVSRERREGSQP